jgi:hypothetical protein
MEIQVLLKTLIQNPPEDLRLSMERLEASADPGQWEAGYLSLSRAMARAALEERLRRVTEPATARCPTCSEATPSSDDAGVSPP